MDVAKLGWYPRSICGEGFRHHDLRFTRVGFPYQSPAGTEYTRYVDIGMPAIPPGLLKCVFYLYRSKEDAEAGKGHGGTGFIVGFPSQIRGIYVYAVANWHVAIDGAFSVLRVNTKSGGVDTFETDPADWLFVPGAGDFAITSIPVNKNHDWNWISLGAYPLGGGEGLAITEAEDKDGTVAIGEDVFMIGRFIDHDGGVRNEPAIRFGNISIRPTPIDDMSNTRPGVGYYCLDMHSRTGFSGSPVFAYRTPGSDLSAAFMQSDGLNTKVNLLLQPTRLWLLGIHCGQFDEEMALNDEREVTGRSGMTVALPAWHIVNLLNSPEIKCKRDENEKRLAQQPRPPRNEGES